MTHDQDEALTMSDRLAVMHAGHVEQVGAPRDVYEEPETLFVADFLGVSNLMDARVQGARDGRCRVAVEDFEARRRRQRERRDGAGEDRDPTRAGRAGTPRSSRRPKPAPGMVERLVFVGSAVQVIVRVATGEKLQALVQNTGKAVPYERGTPVQVHLSADALRVLPAGDRASTQDAEGEPGP